MSRLTIDALPEIDDVDALWQAFRAARESGDDDLADAISTRMAEVQDERRFAELSDQELRARITRLQSLTDTVALVDVPEGGHLAGSQHGAALADINARITAASEPDPDHVRELHALVAEQERRGR